MSDFEDFLFLLESSVERRETKPEKNTKKKKKKKTEAMTEKKGKEKKRKKNSRLKPPAEDEEEEEKRKKRKRRKKKMDTGLNPNETIKPQEVRRKKKVVFDLSPGVARPAHAKLTSLKGAGTRKGAGTQERAAENDSQGSDIHSQDLFITQKTFRTSPPAACRTWTFPEESNRPTPPDAKGQRLEDWRWLKARRRPTQNPFLDRPGLVDSSTQTQNFFTSELVVHRAAAAASGEEPLPLDLSLPHRVRGHNGREEKPRIMKAEPREERGGGGGDSTPSPRFESDNKSGEVTASSEDGEAYGRVVVPSQVRRVQMRLNESFFFKTKGDAHSPRPASPLMKFAQGRDVKRRKSR